MSKSKKRLLHRQVFRWLAVTSVRLASISKLEWPENNSSWRARYFQIGTRVTERRHPLNSWRGLGLIERIRFYFLNRWWVPLTKTILQLESIKRHPKRWKEAVARDKNFCLNSENLTQDRGFQLNNALTKKSSTKAKSESNTLAENRAKA